MGKLRGKMENWEKRWRRDKDEMEARMIGMEKRTVEAEKEEKRLRGGGEANGYEDLERGGRGRKGKGRGEKKARAGERRGRVGSTELERKLEMKEREGRKKNVIIKGVSREGTALQRAKEVLSIE